MDAETIDIRCKRPKPSRPLLFLLGYVQQFTDADTQK